MLLTIIAFVGILGILVLVHELGHFITAKKSGCTVEEFGFGFPPRLFGIKRGETTYSINLLPFGGFVKILGEDGSKEKSPKSFASKKASVRVLILAAGIAMNLVLAMVFFGIGFGVGIPQSIPEEGLLDATIEEEYIQVAFVEKETPALSAGLEPLDKILFYNGEVVNEIDDLKNAVDTTKGIEGTMIIERGGEEQQIPITPRIDYPDDQGPLGIDLVKTGIVSYPWYKAIWLGIKTTFTTLFLIVYSLYIIIRDAFITGDLDGSAVTGPIGIAVMTGQFARQGFIFLLWFAAFLSVNLAFINAIPFPALDGGRILFILIEKIRGGKKVKQSTEGIIHLVGFALLILFILIVTFRDIWRFQDRFASIWDRIIGIF